MHFTHALLRVPAATCANGLTTSSLGAPELQKSREQFSRYLAILSDLNLITTVLPACPAFPDSHFVEDTAVVMPELAIITHPGAAARAGEIASIEPELARYRRIERIVHGRMDGGDVLMVERRFFIGLSNRTNAEGVREFRAIVEPLGYQVDAIEVGAGLHLKSLVNYVGRDTLLLDPASVGHPAFAGFNQIVVDADEEYAGNSLWINDHLIVPDGYPKTLAKLKALGMEVIVTPTSEFRKMDGGLTCLSLRF